MLHLCNPFLRDSCLGGLFFFVQLAFELFFYVNCVCVIRVRVNRVRLLKGVCVNRVCVIRVCAMRFFV